MVVFACLTAGQVACPGMQRAPVPVEPGLLSRYLRRRVTTWRFHDPRALAAGSEPPRVYALARLPLPEVFDVGPGDLTGEALPPAPGLCDR